MKKISSGFFITFSSQISQIDHSKMGRFYNYIFTYIFNLIIYNIFIYVHY